MGLLDSIYRLNLRKRGTINFDLTHTGTIISIADTKGFDELILNIKIVITGGLTKQFNIGCKNWAQNTDITGIRDIDGNSMDFTDTFTALHRIRTSNLTPEPLAAQTIKRTLIVPISGVDDLTFGCSVAAIAVTDGSCVMTGTWELRQGCTYTPNPVQRILKFSQAGDGTTRNFGGTLAHSYLPSNAKFIFASVNVYNGTAQVAKTGEMYFQWKSLPIPGGSANAVEDQMGLKRNIFFENTFTCDWQEVLGQYVRVYVNFDTAPTSSETVVINLYAVL